jgi:glycosyltransferase involved in cell wall biosynthesis
LERPLRLAVVVPATNRPPTLERCVAAIEAGEPPPDELIVVDQPGIGPAAARNAGALRASADVVVFVDGDIELHRDALARIRARLSADPELTAVFGSYDDRPPNVGAVSVFRNLLHHHMHQGAAGPASTFWSGIGAIRRQDFLNAGGFDANRFTRASIEDIELGMRLVAAGLRIELDPGIQGTHLKHWTFRSMVHTDLFRRGVPWVELLLRRRTHAKALNLGWRHRASMICATVAAVAIVRRRFAPAVAAIAGLGILNARFYHLLLRRQPASHLPLAIALHIVHHLTGAASIALALARHAWRRGGARDSR